MKIPNWQRKLIESGVWRVNLQWGRKKDFVNSMNGPISSLRKHAKRLKKEGYKDVAIFTHVETKYK